MMPNGLHSMKQLWAGKWMALLLAALLLWGTFTVPPAALAQDDTEQTQQDENTSGDDASGDASTSDDEEEEEEDTGRLNTNFDLTISSIGKLTLGDNGELKVVATPEDSSVDFRVDSYVWSSSDETIVEILGNRGAELVVLQANKAGTARITVEVTATIGGITKTVSEGTQVEVGHSDIERIDLSLTAVTLEPGGILPQTLTAYVSPETADADVVLWESTDEDIVELDDNMGGSVRISGVNAGRATITASAGGVSATCEVTVKGVQISDDELEMTVGEIHQLAAQPIGSIGNRATWESGNASIAYVDQNGEVTAQTPGRTIITVEIGDYRAECEVTVEESTASTIEEDAIAGQPFSFDEIASDLNTRCKRVLDESLYYVTRLQVPTDEGILFYGYSNSDDTGAGVGSSERYYYRPDSSSRLDLADITFVPRVDFDGVAEITYMGYDENNKYFTGTIRIDVERNDSADIYYNTEEDEPITFSASDFSYACESLHGRDFRYITLTPPSGSRGTLYYNYNAYSNTYGDIVQSGTQYYRSSFPFVDSITYVPDPGYDGEVSISYRGVDNGGNSYSGDIIITVQNMGDSEDGDIAYSVTQDGVVTLRATDFNEFCRDVTGDRLDYVNFDPPDAEEGRMYYNYRSSSDYSSRISSHTNYYRNETPGISRVSFVPANDFTGDVHIDFTGYSEDGERFEGDLRIRVRKAEQSEAITYVSDNGASVTFKGADFNDVCYDNHSTTLSYVYFTLPDSSEGTLYYNNDEVSTSRKYYYDESPRINNIRFTPAGGFTGTAVIPYTGYDEYDDSFSGTVRIDVDQVVPTGSAIVDDGKVSELHYQVIAGGAVSFDVEALNNVSRTETGNVLKYVQFTLPEPIQGVLHYEYDASTGTSSSLVTPEASYYRTGSSRLLKNVSFVAGNNYSGLTTIQYKAWNADDETFEGAITVSTTKATASTLYFTGGGRPITVSADSISLMCQQLRGTPLSHVQFTTLPTANQGRLYLNYSGPMSKGTQVNSGTYYYYDGAPSLQNISFVPAGGFIGSVLVQYTGYDNIGREFQGVLQFDVDSAYSTPPFGDLTGEYASLKPATEFLNAYGIVSGMSPGYYGAGESITRGDFVFMMHRAFGFNAPPAQNFTDVPADAYYANALATARAMGVAAGYSDGSFNPQGTINRQDAMVILCRALNAAGIVLPQRNYNALTNYPDGGYVPAYAQPAVLSLLQAGIIGPSPEGNLNLTLPFTRGEMASILHQVLTL